MATKEDKYEDNVKGKYYVDTECIDCNLCIYICPIEVLVQGDERKIWG